MALNMMDVAKESGISINLDKLSEILQIPVGWSEGFFNWLGGVVSNNLPHGLLKSLIVSGIIDGVGGVLGFASLIMFMFFGIALLDASGDIKTISFFRVSHY